MIANINGPLVRSLQKAHKATFCSGRSFLQLQEGRDKFLEESHFLYHSHYMQTSITRIVLACFTTNPSVGPYCNQIGLSFYN